MKKNIFLFLATLSTCALIATGCNNQPKVESHKLTLEARNGHFADGSNILSLTFNTGTILKDVKGYETPTPVSERFTFMHWKDSDNKEIKLDDKLNYTTDVTLLAYYNTDHTHEYDSYNIHGKTLYGHCKHCGAEIVLGNEELETFADKFLEKQEDSYIVHNDDDFASVVNAKDEVDLYLASGTHYYTYRGLNTKKVRLHGLNNYDEKMNSSLRCYSINEVNNDNKSYGYVWLESINLEVDNVHMLGVMEGHSYYHGLRCVDLICNNCDFIGFQAIYADTFTFSNCSFDSTTVVTEDGEPEYAIWLYGTPSGTFNNCNFVSNGKALKFYSEAAHAGAQYIFTLNRCDFVNKSLTYKKHGAIAIDGNNLGETGSCTFNLNSCTYQINRFNGLAENQYDSKNVHININ